MRRSRSCPWPCSAAVEGGAEMLHCFPTTDIHLLTASGRNLPIDLYLFAQWPPQTPGATWTDLSTVPQLQVGVNVVGGTAVAAVTAHVTGSAAPVAGPTFTVTPNGVGTTMGQTTVSHPTVPLQPADKFRLMRLTVHADVDRFWIPIGSVTMFAGETNRVLPITAIFDDQSQADATGHPYWSYGSSDRTVAVVDRRWPRSRSEGRDDDDHGHADRHPEVADRECDRAAAARGRACDGDGDSLGQRCRRSSARLRDLGGLRRRCALRGPLQADRGALVRHAGESAVRPAARSLCGVRDQ